MRKKELVFIIEKTDSGFSAREEQLPIFSTGESIHELISNCKDAVELYVDDEPRISTMPLRLSLDFEQFFSYYKVLNASHLAERIGMNKTLLSQYVSGKKKPSQKQTERILNGIKQIGIELSEIDLNP